MNTCLISCILSYLNISVYNIQRMAVPNRVYNRPYSFRGFSFTKMVLFQNGVKELQINDYLAKLTSPPVINSITNEYVYSSSKTSKSLTMLGWSTCISISISFMRPILSSSVS